jgi:hypothetical protein
MKSKLNQLTKHPIVLIGLLLGAVITCAVLLFFFGQDVFPGTRKAVDTLLPDDRPTATPSSKVAVFAPLRAADLDPAKIQPFVTGLKEPHGLGIVGNELFVSSWGDRAIYRVNLESGERKLLADELDGAHDMVQSPDGELVVPLFRDGRVVKIRLDDGRVSTLARGLDGPNGITRARTGGYYVTNATGGTLVKIDDDGKVHELASSLKEPAGIVVDNDNIIRLAQFSDPANALIQIQDNGHRATLGSGLTDAESLVVDAGKNLIIGHTDGGKIAFDVYFTRSEAPRRILTTTLPGPAVGPVTDGTYLYFESAAPGQSTVYRVPLPR